MALVAGGDTQAFEDLYDRYHRRAYGLAMTVCRQPLLAEEAVQDAFVAVWRGRSDYSNQRGPVAAWLLTMVRHRAIDRLRREGVHSRRRSGDEALRREPDLTPQPFDQVAGQQDAETLTRLLESIPAVQSEVIRLAFFGGLTHLEIANQLALPTGTVKGRMRLGLQKLRAHFP